jgi:predicted  nucleic acid-binding Zn ribbon protein
MPTVNKSFTLTINVEQFLEACSLTELQEVDLLLNKYIDKKRYTGNSGNSEEFRRIPTVHHDKEKLIRQMFIGKVSEIIGQEKTIVLLKEATSAIENL